MFQPYLLELDGQAAGRFFESRGGSLEAELVMASGQGAIQRKQLGRPRYTDIVLACGTGMSRSFYDWVGSSFGGNVRRHDAAVVALDRSSKPVRRLEARTALVTSLVLPELNKSDSKDATLTIGIKPSFITVNKPGQDQNLGTYASSVSKSWRTSDFRVNIAGLETACRQVTRIQSLNLGDTVAVDATGESREQDFTPGKITFSDVIVELPKAQAEAFTDWSKDSVSNRVGAREREGSIDFLAPGSTAAYFTVKLSGLGVSEVATGSSGSIQVRMYCTGMAFSAGSAAIH